MCAFANNPGFMAINPAVVAAKPQVSLAELRFFRRSRYSAAIKSVSIANSVSSSAEGNPRTNVDFRGTEAVEPIYEPTLTTRPLRTPHSGYHFDGTARKFFEGWYFKVSIPEVRQSFCFMYSVENPSFTKKLSRLEEAQYGPRFTGVGAQILGADDKLFVSSQKNLTTFGGVGTSCHLGIHFWVVRTCSLQRKRFLLRNSTKECWRVSKLHHYGTNVLFMMMERNTCYKFVNSGCCV